MHPGQGSLLKSPPAFLTRLDTPVIGWTTTIAVAACAAGTVFADPIGDAGLLGAALAFVLGGGGLFLWRRSLDKLPLVLSETALRGEYGGRPAYRFRARLGLGRQLVRPRASIRFEPDDGEAIDVTPRLPALERLTGPWTLVVVDDGAIGERAGRFTVQVTGREGGKPVEATGTFRTDTFGTGQFGADLKVQGGRLVVDPTAWETPVASQ